MHLLLGFFAKRWRDMPNLAHVGQIAHDLNAFDHPHELLIHVVDGAQDECVVSEPALDVERFKDAVWIGQVFNHSSNDRVQWFGLVSHGH